MTLVAMSNVTRETADLICKRLRYTNSVDWFGLEIFSHLYLDEEHVRSMRSMKRNSEEYANW